MSEERNARGFKVSDYKCPRCGYLHASWFAQNKPKPKRCFRCHYIFSEEPQK